MPLNLPPEGTRQRQVLDLVCTGLSNKEIAREMGISPRTVEIHRAKAMSCIGATSATHAVALVYADCLQHLQNELATARLRQCRCELAGGLA